MGTQAHGRERPEAMLQKGLFPGSGRGIFVTVLFMGFKGRRRQIGRRSGQNALIAGDADVERGDIGQKQFIIADAGAHAPGGGVPPMLHVALRKLMGGA